MAEETKPVAEAVAPEVVAPAVVAAPAVDAPAAETKPAEDTMASTAAAAEPAPEVPDTTAVTEMPADAETAAAEESKKEEEEVKPIDEGPLSHKGEGANFPKNLIYSKKLFWFGSDPVELKGFKADKVTEVANHLTAWAAETGKGLLFYSDKSEKSAISGVIPLSEASEPQLDGPHKFHLTAKGHKHVFKAATPAERDNWVAQIKAKITEAKEIALTIQESEVYKKTLETLKPVALKHDEKTAEPAMEATAETDAAAPETSGEAPAEPAAEAPLESPAEEVATPMMAKGSEKRSISANRKRGSIFGLLGGKKDKAQESPATEAPAADAPAAEATPVETMAAVEASPEATAEAGEVAPEAGVEAATEPKLEEKKKPMPTKRSSIFGNLPFGKKKGETVTTPTAEDTAVATDAPVIPAVATTEPLSTETPAEATTEAPAEAADATTAESPMETKTAEKDMKEQKRKSTLPFGFGKKKADVSDDEVESPKLSPFSKFRATIKGKGKQEKVAETEEIPMVPEAPAEAAETDEAVKPAEATPEPTAETANEGAPPASQVVTAAA